MLVLSIIKSTSRLLTLVMFSPPPLRHPVPKHPSYIPEPPSTPVSPHGYQRYSSSPVPPTLPPYANPYAHNLPPADLAPWDIDTTTAQLGMRLGHSAVAAGQEYMQRNVRSLMCVCVCPFHTCFPVWHTLSNDKPQAPLQRLQLLRHAQAETHLVPLVP